MPKLLLDHDSLVLYTNVLSPVGVAVSCIYDHVSLEYKRYELNFGSSEHKSKAYVKNINPRGQMPVIKDGYFTLFEGVSLARYASKYLTSTFKPCISNVRLFIMTKN